MNKKLFYTILVMPIIALTFYNSAFSRKNFAPAEQTGAIGEPSCGSSTTSCHFRANCGSEVSILSALNYDITLTANGTALDTNFKYTPGETYLMEFIINRPTTRNGFSLTAIDLNDDYAGTLSVDAGSEAEISSNNSNYVGHTNSLGVSQWSFKWQAPVTNTGNVKFYASANKASDGNGPQEMGNTTPCSDTIIPVVFEIKEFVEDAVDTTSTGIQYVSLENNISVANNPILNNIVSIETVVDEAKKYFISIYDLSGKRIAYQEQVFHVGIKNIEIPLEAKGLFILNITTNKNEIANYKILN